MEQKQINKNVFNANATDVGVITLSKDNPTFVRGWYGVCDDKNICQSFDLRTLPSGALFKAVQVEKGGKSRISFFPSLPAIIPQAFSNLDCGYYYELTFNKFEGEVNIPGFVNVKLGQVSDNRLDECDAIGIFSKSNEMQQDAVESTYVAGWYGRCDDTDCTSFDLKTLSSDVVFKVTQVSEDGFSRESFSPSLPSFVPQPFSTLECGFIYEFILKPGNEKFTIPHFVPVYGKLEDMGRISLGGCKLDEPTPTPIPLPIIEFTNATDSTISVEWTLLGMNQEKVKLEISEINTSSVINQVNYDAEVSEHTFVNLNPSSSYKVRIASIDEDISSEWVEINVKTTIPGSFGTVTKKLNDDNKPVLTFVGGDNMPTWNYASIFKQTSGTFSLISRVPYEESSNNNFEFTDESVNEDGVYQYKIQFNNGFDGSFSEIHEIIVDTQAPNKPSPTTTSPTRNRRPEWTWNSISDAVKYHITLNSQTATTTETKYQSTEDLVDGEHILEIVSEDSSGNISEVGTSKVLIDNEPPTKPVLNTLSNLTRNRKPVWTWETSADISQFGIKFDDMDEIISSDVSFTPENNLNDGSYTLKVRAEDALGNSSAYAESTVVVDISPANVPEPKSDDKTKNTEVTWTWDSVEDAVGYRIVLDGVEVANNSNLTTYTSPTLDEGIHTLEVASIDRVGNLSEYGTKDVTIDITAPVPTQPNTNSPTNNQKPTWTWPTAPSAVEYFVKLYINNEGEPSSVSVGNSTTFTPSENLPHGSHRIQVWSIDDVGNQSLKRDHTVVIDTELPAVPVPNTTSPTNNTKPTWTWDAVSDAVSYNVILNDTDPVEVFTNSFQSPIQLSEGTHTIKVETKDEVGNVSSSYGTHTVLIDTTSPDKPVLQVDVVSPTKNSRPVWSWPRTDDAIEYEVVLDTNAGIKQTSNLYTPPVNLSDGIHTLKVKVRDSVGNWSDFSVPSQVTIDTNPPKVLNVTGPTITRDRTPTFTWTSEGEPVEYSVKFGDASEIIQPSSNFAVESNLDDGSYDLVVKARDEANNWSDDISHTVKIYCIPDSYEKFNIASTNIELSTIKGSIGLSGFSTEMVIALKSEEFLDGSTGIVVAHLEGQFLGMMTLTALKVPSTSIKIYLQDGHTCYEADLGEAQSADTHHVINFVKILK